VGWRGASGLGRTKPLRQTRRYSVTCRHSPELLLRIVGACWRRRLRVVAVDYQAPRPGHGGHLWLSIVADDVEDRRLVRWLSNLIDVEEIRYLDQSGVGTRNALSERSACWVAPAAP
jgi:acetolactate synthase regulatory subunit